MNRLLSLQYSKFIKFELLLSFQFLEIYFKNTENIQINRLLIKKKVFIFGGGIENYSTYFYI